MTRQPGHPMVDGILRRIGRDRETIELFSDFLSASDEALSRAEELLRQLQRMNSEAQPSRELHRVFHNIKAVSILLQTLDITRLADATERLLAGACSGRYALTGRVLELLTRATAALRRLLFEVRRAVELDAEVRCDPSLDGLIAELGSCAA